MRPLGQALVRGAWLGQGLALVAAAAWLGVSLSSAPSAPTWVRIYGAKPTPLGPIVLRFEHAGQDPLTATGSHRRLQVSSQVAATNAVTYAPARLTQRIELDDEGGAIASFNARSLEALGTLNVQSEGQSLAFGPLRWPKPTKDALTRRSGWFQGTLRGDTLWGSVRVGVLDGRLVRGRKARLEVLFESASGGPRVVPLRFEAQGLTLLDQAHLPTHTDELGRAFYDVLPEDISASVTVTLGDKGKTFTEFFGEVPIEQAGSWGSREANLLCLNSLIPLPRLHYALVTEQGLLARGSLELDGATLKNCQVPVGSLDLRKVLAWLVVGREPALDGNTAIGWPVSVNADGPQDTVSFKESLLLDGKSQALAGFAHHVNQRARVTLVSFVSVAVLFLGSVVSLWLRSRVPIANVYDDEHRIVGIPLQSRHGVVGLLALLALCFLALGAWIAGRLYGG